MPLKSTKPTIVFDLDGTLADTALDLVPSINRTIAQYDLMPVSVAQVGHITAVGAKAMIEHAYHLNNQDISPELLEELFEYFLVDYNENLSENTVLYPGAENCLKEFATNEWLLAVCTNKPEGLAVKLLSDLGMADRFAVISGGDSYSFRKPDARHLHETIADAKGHSSSAIMVGDTITDILAAKNANIPVVAVDFGYSEHHVSHHNPDRIISHYDELFDVASKLIVESK